jgi:secondary thiamine-phosphate synthase enzyme
MNRLKVSTYKKRAVIDITEQVQAELRRDHARQSGVCHLLVLHTTAALTTADLDPGTDLDMLDAFEAMMPKLRYRHPHDPSHVPDHILSALIGASLSLIVGDGSLVLGTWQRVVLIELDGPRTREIAMAFCEFST